MWVLWPAIPLALEMFSRTGYVLEQTTILSSFRTTSRIFFHFPPTHTPPHTHPHLKICQIWEECDQYYSGFHPVYHEQGLMFLGWIYLPLWVFTPEKQCCMCTCTRAVCTIANMINTSVCAVNWSLPLLLFSFFIWSLSICCSQEHLSELLKRQEKQEKRSTTSNYTDAFWCDKGIQLLSAFDFTTWKICKEINVSH